MQLVSSVKVFPAWLRRPDGPLCLRPGERPAWLDVSEYEPLWPVWRAAAATAHLPLDVVLSLSLEWELVTGLIEATRVVPSCVETALEASEQSACRLPPAELRAWVAQLESGVSDQPLSDDLPEVTLPQRLVHRLAPTADLTTLIDLDALSAARSCDACAARHGMTLEVWMFHAQLRAAAQLSR